MNANTSPDDQLYTPLLCWKRLAEIRLKWAERKLGSRHRTLNPMGWWYPLSIRASLVLHQFFPDNRNLLRGIRTDAHLIAFDTQHCDFNEFTGGQFNKDVI